MAINYGEVVFNPTGAYVASVGLTGGYGTPVKIEHIGTLTFEYESDTDDIMSGGMIVEHLAILKDVKGTLNMGTLNMAAMAVIAGNVQSDAESGTTPNRYATHDLLFGGSGLPYFGLIASYAATNGANVLVGFPKVILDTYPSFTVDQNKFKVGEAGFMGLVPNTSIRTAVRLRRFETAGSIPTSASTWDNWFTGIWS